MRIKRNLQGPRLAARLVPWGGREGTPQSPSSYQDLPACCRVTWRESPHLPCHCVLTCKTRLETPAPQWLRDKVCKAPGARWAGSLADDISFIFIVEPSTTSTDFSSIARIRLNCKALFHVCLSPYVLPRNSVVELFIYIRLHIIILNLSRL